MALFSLHVLHVSSIKNVSILQVALMKI